MGAMQKILSLTADIAEIREQRDQAIRDLVSDLEWMDVPVIRTSGAYLPRDAEPGDTFHLLMQVEEASGYVRYYTHEPADDCQQPWCDRKIGTGPHYQRGKRSGNRLGHFNLGEHILIGQIGGEVYLSPRRSIAGR